MLNGLNSEVFDVASNLVLTKHPDEVNGNIVEECIKILSDNPLFFLINSYTTGLSAQILINIMSMTLVKKYGGKAEADEIGIPMQSNGLVLPCGISGRWENV